MTTILDPVSNGAQELVAYEWPFIATVRIRGITDILFHGWNVEAIEGKAKAAKNSKAKKTDNLESYVYRCEDGTIGIPGAYLHGAIINAGRFRQDPRSPRKSASDLLKAAVIPLTERASLGIKEWDKIDRRRVTIQRQGITRERPALREGWTASFELLVTIPEYVAPTFLLDLLNQAGRLVGIGDFRPTYGRFAVTHFETRLA